MPLQSNAVEYNELLSCNSQGRGIWLLDCCYHVCTAVKLLGHHGKPCLCVNWYHEINSRSYCFILLVNKKLRGIKQCDENFHLGQKAALWKLVSSFERADYILHYMEHMFCLILKTGLREVHRYFHRGESKGILFCGVFKLQQLVMFAKFLYSCQTNNIHSVLFFFKPVLDFSIISSQAGSCKDSLDTRIM